MFKEISKEKIMHHVQHGNFNELLELFCKINENEIIVDYYYFKYLGNSQTYTIFTNFVVGHIDHILQLHDKFDVQLSIKKLSVMEINKHLNYIRFVSNMLKTKYQNKMGKCLIHNASGVFSQIYEIIVPFIDKDTQEKIQLI